MYRLTARLLMYLALPIVVCSVAQAQVFPAGTHGGGKLEYVAGVPIVILQGTGTEMGEQSAALLAESSSELLQFPKQLFSAAGAERFWPLAVGASKRLLMQAPQQHRNELAAIAKHESIDADSLGVANTLLELRRMGCSTLIVEPARSATGGPLFGRNFDFPPLGMLDKFNLVTIARPANKHAFVSVGYPGMVGVLSGMNDEGLTVATLDVYASGNGSAKFDPSGVPMALVFRQILEECTTLDEAEALLKRTKATTWANLAVCDRDRGAVFEITPSEVMRRNARDAVVTCTNHFRSEGLAVDTRCWRYDCLQKAKAKTSLDVEAVHAHLHEANQGSLTLQTMIFEPRELVLHLAFGKPPSSALALKRLELRELLLGVGPRKTQ